MLSRMTLAEFHRIHQLIVTHQGYLEHVTQDTSKRRPTSLSKFVWKQQAAAFLIFPKLSSKVAVKFGQPLQVQGKILGVRPAFCIFVGRINI